VHVRTSVAVPPEVTVTLEVASEHVMPAGGVVDRLTVPVKPPCDVTVIVLVAAMPTFAVTGLGLAVRVKVPVVPRLNVTTTLWDSVPLVPVTVTVKEADAVGAVRVHARVAVCGEVPKVTLAGSVHVAVLDGTDATCARLTVPVKPFSAVRVIVEDPDVVVEVTVLGEAAMVKSVTVKVTVAE